MSPDFTNQSEWNEQQYFSSLFFGITAQCRMSQAMGDTLNWKNGVESKISMVMGIADEEKEKPKLREFRQNINNLYNQYISIPLAHKKKGSGLKLLTILNNKLFEVEAEIDSIANKHMPFLKLRPKLDIDMW
jgi:hypothetical protein